MKIYSIDSETPFPIIGSINYTTDSHCRNLLQIKQNVKILYNFYCFPVQNLGFMQRRRQKNGVGGAKL